MKIHLYALCWNDMHMLEFFFRHYSPWIDRFLISDDHSTDGSREFLESRADVEVMEFTRTVPDSFVYSALEFYNSAWKQSIGDADWVIITNIDEFHFHQDMRGFLARMLEKEVTMIPALGYQMISQDFPDPGANLAADYRMGAPWANMSKVGLFRPDQIVDTGFSPGRHTAIPRGSVRYPDRDEVLNLHYKYLGVSQTHDRHQQLAERLGVTDIAEKMGHKYFWPRERLAEDFQMIIDTQVDVATIDPHATHPGPRWWR